MASNPPQITATLVELADTLVSDYELFDYLDRLLECCTAALGASAGGVMLTANHAATTRLQLLACTDERTRVLELFELQRQEGPCVDSHRLGTPVIEEDLTQTERWPVFTPVALDHGYQAVYALPMRLRGMVIGALNLFHDQPASVDADDLRTAQAFTDMATIGILQQRAVREAQELAGQLQIALNSRVVIEQAKGILAERLNTDMEHAYQALRWYSRERNKRLRLVAAALVNGDLDPDEFGRRRPPGS
jgi:GAF domain-containing protein